MSPAEEARDLLEALGARCGGPLDSRSPIDGSVIGGVSESSDTDEACERARRAFLEWRTVPAPRRGDLIRLLGEELRAAKEPLARLVTIECGKIVQESLGEVQEMIDICDFAVGPALWAHNRQRTAEPPDDRAMAPAGPGGCDHGFQLPGRSLGVERGARACLR